MCGIAGLYLAESGDDLERQCFSMVRTLGHRGPDNTGVWSDRDLPFALGHSRLSIIDTSPAGSQPMVSSDERYVISFNGEIYNYQDLGRSLAKDSVSLTSSSDTEVLVEAFAKWGIEKTLREINGMFAIALWDRKDKTLFLIRDRIGIKPIYWGCISPKFFFFGSELKALRSLGNWDQSINEIGIDLYLQLRQIPGDTSIYRNVQKLRPGELLRWRPGERPQLSFYWALPDFSPSKRRTALSDEEAVTELDELLNQSIEAQLVSDVPIGALLSGGVDSSIVSAIMQSRASKSIKTFSIGFDDSAFDESRWSKETAAFLGTDHQHLVVDSTTLLNEAMSVPDVYDEPFADSSQIPTLALSRLTKRHVTVALSGDGGDEVFGGYERHRWARTFNQTLRLPLRIRTLLQRLLKAPSSKSFSVLLMLFKGLSVSDPATKLQKMLAILDCEDRDQLYKRLTTVMAYDPRLLAKHPTMPAADFSDIEKYSLLQYLQFRDAKSYLPDDVLTKVDRASMAVSLEVRVPLLDHRLLAFMWSLPDDMRVRNGKTKWLLRQVLKRYVPTNLTERPKMGFAVPLAKWLAGPLREWSYDILHSNSPMYTFVNKSATLEILARQHSGEHQLAEQVWSLINLCIWFHHHSAHERDLS